MARRNQAGIESQPLDRILVLETKWQLGVVVLDLFMRMEAWAPLEAPAVAVQCLREEVDQWQVEVAPKAKDLQVGLALTGELA
jgi:hypothetical protein